MKRFYNFCGGAAVILLIVALSVRPSVYMPACKEGLEIFIESVFPALFPFFFFSGLLGVFGADRVIAKLMRKPVNAIYGTPAISGYIMALSFVSGYPVGARLVSESCKNGLIGTEDAKRIISFCSTSGPLFTVGVIGTKILGNAYAGWVILALHLSGAIVNGLLFCAGHRTRDGKDELVLPPSGNSFNKALEGAVGSILRVGGCIVIFNVIVAFLQDTGVLGALSNAIGIFGVSEPLRPVLLTSLLEVTKGAYMITDGISLGEVIPILSFAVAFGGVSVGIQSISFLSECGVKTSYYIVVKMSQAIITYALAVLVCVIVF